MRKEKLFPHGKSLLALEAVGAPRRWDYDEELRMQREEHELEQEEPEKLVERIRWHIGEAESKRDQPSQANYHDEIVTELIQRLSMRVLPKAEAIAKRICGTAYDLHSEGLVEIFKELNRVIRAVDTREGLESRFAATFERVAIDACRRVKSADHRISGKGNRRVQVESGDETADQAGDPESSVLELKEDPASLQGFLAIIGENAFETIAHRMKPRQVQVMTLRLQGFDFVEIGQQLGIHRDTASSDFEKACRFIKTNIAPESGTNL